MDLRWTPLLALVLLAPGAAAQTSDPLVLPEWSDAPQAPPQGGPQEAPAGDGARQREGCDNHGHIVQVGVGNQYECHSIVQHCDQGSGAGAGAGAGGTGTNDAGASASAGTRCSQDADDDPDDGSGGARPLLHVALDD